MGHCFIVMGAVMIGMTARTAIPSGVPIGLGIIAIMCQLLGAGTMISVGVSMRIRELRPFVKSETDK